MTPQYDPKLASVTVNKAGDDAVGLQDIAIGEFAGLTSDSRAVKPGYLFAALGGSRTDGAGYIKDAVARGAAAILARPEAAPAAEMLKVRFIADANPRLRLARLAAAFYPGQPGTVAAVTGTKGKSSIVAFLREIWTALGKPAASLGTVGVVGPKGATPLSHTTPDPVEIHRLLAELKRDGVDHLALEASSHGLDQYRLDGVRISGCGFSNITRDHMDYHATFADYLTAKLRLFREVTAAGGVAVVNADADHADHFIAAAQEHGLTLLTVGVRGQTIRLVTRSNIDEAQELSLVHAGITYNVTLPLAGAFQASNALVAAGLAIGLLEDGERDAVPRIFAALENLKGAPGRMEKVAFAACGAPIYVDYAHTPDSLEKILLALRPHAMNQLRLVFGCGGDRDKGKRPLMGAIAARLADETIVTDDNPRSEDPAAIRKEILAAAPGAHEIADRAQAIRTGVASLRGGDILVIAGKGHETGQYVGTEVRPFSDRVEAVAAALVMGGRTP